MRRYGGKIVGDLRVAEDFTLNGMVTGTITVADGAHLELNGTAHAMILESGSSATLKGTIARDVENRGGELEVFGVIAGSLRTLTGTTEVDPEAMIGRPPAPRRARPERVEVVPGGFPLGRCLLCHQSPCIVLVRWSEQGAAVIGSSGSKAFEAHLCAQHHTSTGQVAEILRSRQP